jgi:putative transposase
VLAVIPCWDIRSVQVRYSYRLRPSALAESRLVAEYGLCRWVWNKCIEISKETHKRNQGKAPADRKTCGPAQLDKMLTGWRAEHEWLRAGGSVVQQQAVRDFGRSRAKALQDIKNKVPRRRQAGLPGFKKKGVARPSLSYTKNGFRVHDRKLKLAGGIVVPVVWSRPLPSQPSSVRVYRDAIGHWYASFVVETEIEPLPATGRAVGIDWGVTDIATTTSDEHDLPHPEFNRQAAALLARWQRQQARRQQGSAGRRRSGRRAARTYAKVARQRQDYARKWTKKLVRDFDVIAAEDYRPRFVMKTTMARKAADAAASAAKQELISMAAKHGRDLRLVPPAHTTTDCSSCGARAKRLPLSERTYTCTACGVILPRDKNSARMMLVRAGLDPTSADGVSHDAVLPCRAA